MGDAPLFKFGILNMSMFVTCPEKGELAPLEKILPFAISALRKSNTFLPQPASTNAAPTIPTRSVCRKTVEIKKKRGYPEIRPY
ncbi:hypothetical protein C7W93_06660 [Glaciimonas sp. PCH181]|nr:hypothetical protein C7W93_06660 [Glaciimonas sp. PCH181]